MSELEHEVGILRAENLKLRNEVARLSQQTQHSQPQLTIPKSIADELDNIFYGLDATSLDYVLDETRPNGVIAFNDYYLKNKNIIALYLASRALGVDLVKVVEGIDDNY
ncbi:hypothetical protein LLUC047_07760 [Lactococcus cremoris]|uniref:Phage protein n=2 Tax=Lactococcus lactis subsp. cremoris TaxID=1359 RepID=T0WKY4_LACLC|nr:hypothetical protein [Lactococcus cremoris]EQC93989.1 hypothetical protein LLT3_15690 [Lactococcus cremoris subsp. cremoris TIFN3]QSD63213.1 hypothetical protein LL1196_1592 [Lactococcus cremoris]WKB14441.1 hypothetical protein LLUC047_07760 [Lactococcus cremoris]